MSQFGPGDSLGQYKLLEQIGRGGMATVYKAYQASLDRLVAVKVLPHFFAEEPTFLERFRLEAQAVARLRHTNILTVFDYGEENGITFLVSEYIPGGTLADRLGTPLPLDFVVSIAQQIGSALDYAHGRDIVHRDVKPSNILMTDDGTAVLADFGLARILGGNRRLTASGMYMGTPEYMSPEQSLQGTIDGRSDIYSLGVVLYEMLVGATPYTADTPTALILAHIHEPLPLPSKRNPAISHQVEEVLVKALAKDPADRFAAAGLLVQALATAAGIIQSEPGRPLPTVSPTRITSFTPVTDVVDPLERLATQRGETPGPPGGEPTSSSSTLPVLSVPDDHVRSETLVAERTHGPGEVSARPTIAQAAAPPQARPTAVDKSVSGSRRNLIFIAVGIGLVVLIAIFLVARSQGSSQSSGIVSLEINPQSGPPGTNFALKASGFRNGETITIEFITPAGKPIAGRQYQAEDGSLTENVDPTAFGKDVAAGLYTIKASGDKGSQASTSFRVTAGEWATVRPLVARVGTVHQIFGGGFSSDEDVKIAVNGPGLPTPITLSAKADKQGRFDIDWQSKASNLGGEYRITAEGSKGHRATARMMLTNR